MRYVLFCKRLDSLFYLFFSILLSYFIFLLYREMNRQSFRCFGGPSSGEWEMNSVYKHLAFGLMVIDFRQYSDRVALKMVFL